MRVDWEKWIPIERNPTLGSVEVVIQVLPKSYGMVSGGSPYRIAIRTVGISGIDQAVRINNVKVVLDGSRIIDVKNSSGISRTFEQKDVQGSSDKVQANFSFEDAIEIDYEKYDSLEILLGLQIQTENGNIEGEVKRKFAKEHYKKWQFINPLTL